MENKYKVIIALTLILTSFAFGRYSAPETIKTVEIEKKTEDKTKDIDKHKDTVIVEVINPDGTKTTTTKTVEDTNTKVTDKKTSETSKTEEETKSSSKTTLAALSGVQLQGTPEVVYGASVHRPIFGPIGIQVFGLSSKTFGIGLSLTF